MSLSIRPTAPSTPALPRTAAPVSAPAPVVVTPMPTVVYNDVMGNSLRDAKDVVNAALKGGELTRPSGFKSAALSFIRKGQAALGGLVKTFMPAPAAPVGVATDEPRPPLTLKEKVKKVGQAAMAFAMPVAGAAAVAAGLGWIVGPWVPFVGGHVFGAVTAALAVGHTTGFLMHGSMRLPFMHPKGEGGFQSAGATVASAGIGAGLAAIIMGAAGATVGLPVLAAGALIGAGPRLLEWAIVGN